MFKYYNCLLVIVNFLNNVYVIYFFLFWYLIYYLYFSYLNNYGKDNVKILFCFYEYDVCIINFWKNIFIEFCEGSWY